MKLVVISYKVCWADEKAPTGYSTVAGYPFQMAALSELFNETRLIMLRRPLPLPSGTVPITGNSLSVLAPNEPAGSGWRRKIRFLAWLVKHLPTIWRQIRWADAVHALVPGDVGTLGILIALLQRKPLFVRHCGTWGHKATLADRFLAWMLPRIAHGKTVVMATGGAETPPEPKKSHIRWIFSTTLTMEELGTIPTSTPWRYGMPLRLITVGRLSEDKNTQAAVRALPLIQTKYPQTTLSIVGDGLCQEPLERLAEKLGVANDVIFHGNVAHEAVMNILSQSHLFIFPTRVAEGFPKAVLEAMACGLPVIAPPISVIPYLLKQGGGRLLANTNAESVADAVLDLITYEESLEQMSFNAYLTSRQYTLENWRDTIRERLEAQWGCLKDK